MRVRVWTAAVVAFFVIALAASGADAAVRKCGALVSSEVAAAPTEILAKKKALEQWRTEALKRGAGFDSWRLAHQKALKCFPKDGGFECVAFGQPCIIDQTPRSPPKLPGDTGTGI
ncbi:MAG: hypothetical protein IPL91_01795 [Hyphomicrobium sp.]|nr:hypothetical protein [Hyphomicrobium sp.]